MPTMVPAETEGDERGALLDFLDAQRGGIRRALHGLTEEQAASTPSVSALSLSGLLKHITECERGWLATARQSAAEEVDPSQWGESFQPVAGETVAGLLAAYERVAEETEKQVRSVASLEETFPLPDAPWNPPNSRRSWRWLMLHLIEEVGRHAGHADIVRESVDGKTAFELVWESGAAEKPDFSAWS